MRVIEGVIRSGRQVGRTLGAPTINIAAPRDLDDEEWGVYCSLVSVKGVTYPALTHLGPPKTFFLSRPTCESFLFRFNEVSKDNTPVSIRLLFRLRGVEKFSSVKKLKQQIQEDIKKGKKFFGL